MDQKNNRLPKVVVYTAIFGRYESIKEPMFVDQSSQYLLFTDDKSLKSNGWKIITIESEHLNLRRTSRLPKILAHRYLPQHDISIYLDSQFQLSTDNLFRMIEECLKGQDIALYPHKNRKCMYQEIDHCVKSGKVKKDVAARIKKKLIQRKFPRRYGLFENGFIIRKNTTAIRKLNELWWVEYMSGSERDQLSFMYCLWKLKISANKIQVGKLRNNPYLKYFNHSS